MKDATGRRRSHAGVLRDMVAKWKVFLFLWIGDSFEERSTGMKPCEERVVPFPYCSRGDHRIILPPLLLHSLSLPLRYPAGRPRPPPPPLPPPPPPAAATTSHVPYLDFVPSSLPPLWPGEGIAGFRVERRKGTFPNPRPHLWHRRRDAEWCCGKPFVAPTTFLNCCPGYVALKRCFPSQWRVSHILGGANHLPTHIKNHGTGKN